MNHDDQIENHLEEARSLIADLEVDLAFMKLALKAHRHAMGVDAFQAIHAALEYIAMDLYVSQYHMAGSLYFDEIGQGYGLPLPCSGRDQAIGRDRSL